MLALPSGKLHRSQAHQGSAGAAQGAIAQPSVQQSAGVPAGPLAMAGPALRLVPPMEPVQLKWKKGPIPEPDEDEKDPYYALRERLRGLEGDFSEDPIYWNDETNQCFVYYPQADEEPAFGFLYGLNGDATNVEGVRAVDIHQEATGVAPAERRLAAVLLEKVEDQSKAAEAVKALVARDTEADLSWLATKTGAEVWSVISYANQKEIRLAELRPMFARYSIATVMDWVRFYGVKVTKAALAETSTETRAKWVSAFLSCTCTAESAPAFKQLVRILGYLNDNANTMAVFQADVPYQSSQDPPSRTGFLCFTFTDQTFAEIHTHWNELAQKIVSMHVQVNQENGAEINQWPQFFTRVIQAVVDAHNASATYPPTTQPANKPLTT